MAQQKFYVVWQGHKPGIYDSWEACKAAVSGYKNATYKSFPDRQSAVKAFGESYELHKGKKIKRKLTKEEAARIGLFNPNSIAVDAASSGNPGKMEYRGVDTLTRKELFHMGPFEKATNNIGEFLAIVHGLALLQQKKSNRILYTDSRTAISWVKRKKCNTKLKPSAQNKALFELIGRAEKWLQQHDYTTPVVKWETAAWGEIPADFGRK